jgi:hypothetical protein
VMEMRATSEVIDVSIIVIDDTPAGEGAEQ